MRLREFLPRVSTLRLRIGFGFGARHSFTGRSPPGDSGYSVDVVVDRVTTTACRFMVLAALVLVSDRALADTMDAPVPGFLANPAVPMIDESGTAAHSVRF